MPAPAEDITDDRALAAVARRLVLALLAALAGWEVGRVMASFLVTQVLAPGAALPVGAGGGAAAGTLVALLLQVAVALAVAAPVALLLLRPVLAYRDRA